MAEAPVIRDLNGLINTIGASVNPLKQQIDADIAANQTYGDAQVAGLEAKKVRAFGDIEQGAQNKGMFFSGFSPDSQARYTADTYLPALASLQQTIAQTRSGMLKEKLGLDRDVFDKAFSSQETDRSVLADWNKMTAQQQFDASESEKQRVFTAGQNEKDRAATLAASSMRSSGGGGGGGSSGGGSNGSTGASLTKNAAGGWDVSGGYDLAGYARATGKDLITLLGQGDAKDRQAAKYYRDNINLGRGEAYAMDRLQNYDRPTAFYRGG